MHNLFDKALENIIEKFDFRGDFLSAQKKNTGLINATYILSYKSKDGLTKRYVLQRINTNVFKDPKALMENIDKVTKYIRNEALLSGKDINRSTLNIIKTKNDNLYYKDDNDGYWRAYDYIEGCITYDKVNKLEDFYKAGVALGDFQKILQNYPCDELCETIKNFHNTPSRYKDLCMAIDEDRVGRKALVENEIAFFHSRKDFYNIITNEILSGTIPVRVTHNDTKFNNVMLDEKTGEVACFIDLDTVMPGSALYDFGDSIRSGTNMAKEDEENIDNVSFNIDLFKVYVDGYLSQMKDLLTPTEIQLLPESAILLTLECGMRFLTDYLNGDVYFGANRPNQNIDRAKGQIKLACDMEKNIKKMRKLVELAL